jgi:hypothetical protein
LVRVLDSCVVFCGILLILEKRREALNCLGRAFDCLLQMRVSLDFVPQVRSNKCSICTSIKGGSNQASITGHVH